jgi:hypothetical protein
MTPSTRGGRPAPRSRTLVGRLGQLSGEAPRRLARRWGDTPRRFRQLYGDTPLHLLILLASFALCGYAAFRWLSYDWLSIAVWFVGAAVLHDIVLVPLYGGVDWVMHKALRGRRPAGGRAVNHIRVPAFVSLLLLLVYWPLVLDDVPRYPQATDLSAAVFLGRWLLVTAVLFACSAVWFAVARVRASRTGRSLTHAGTSPGAPPTDQD